MNSKTLNNLLNVIAAVLSLTSIIWAAVNQFKISELEKQINEAQKLSSDLSNSILAANTVITDVNTTTQELYISSNRTTESLSQRIQFAQDYTTSLNDTLNQKILYANQFSVELNKTLTEKLVEADEILIKLNITINQETDSLLGSIGVMNDTIRNRLVEVESAANELDTKLESINILTTNLNDTLNNKIQDIEDINSSINNTLTLKISEAQNYSDELNKTLSKLKPIDTCSPCPYNYCRLNTNQPGDSMDCLPNMYNVTHETREMVQIGSLRFFTLLQSFTPWDLTPQSNSGWITVRSKICDTKALVLLQRCNLVSNPDFPSSSLGDMFNGVPGEPGSIITHFAVSTISSIGAVCKSIIVC